MNNDYRFNHFYYFTIKIIFSIYLLLSLLSTSLYAANPLGFEIGKANYDNVRSELSSVLNLKYQGTNKFSGGKMLISDNAESLGYDGLKRVTFIFDHKNILTAVVMRLNRDEMGNRNAGFMYVYNQLNEKYLPNFQKLQPMGKLIASFTTPAKDVHIRMSSKSASDFFDLQYLSSNFLKRFNVTRSKKKNIRESAQYKGVIKNNFF